MKRKNYSKPTIGIFNVKLNIMSSSCICHGHCACNTDNNAHSHGHGNQPMCNCGNRPSYNPEDFDNIDEN